MVSNQNLNVHNLHFTGLHMSDCYMIRWWMVFIAYGRQLYCSVDDATLFEYHPRPYCTVGALHVYSKVGNVVVSASRVRR